MEVMEWREDIEDAQAEQDETALAALHGRFLGMEEEAVAAVAAAWCDALGNLEQWGFLCKLLLRKSTAAWSLAQKRDDTARQIFAANGCLGGSGAGRSGKRVPS